MEPIKLSYLLLFIPIITIIYYMLPFRNARNFILLIGSVFVLSLSGPVMFVVVIATLLINYLASIYIVIHNQAKRLKAKRMLILTIFVDLVLMIGLRYSDAIIKFINQVADAKIPTLNIHYSIGIIFYTLSLIEYLILLYNRKQQIETNFINYALYVTFFPRLFIMPHISPKEFFERIRSRQESLSLAGKGLEKIIIGIAKVTMLSQFSYNIWNNIYSEGVENISFLATILGIFMFAASMYFLLSGLMNLSIGIFNLFGFEVAEGFNYPFVSASYVEFWNAWYIPIVNWFNTYLTDPLETNKPKNSYIGNILFTWFILGIWIGISPGLIVWGIMCGIFLVLEIYVFEDSFKRLPQALKYVLTAITILITFAPAGCTTLKDSFVIYKALFTGNGKFIDNIFAYNFFTPIVFFIVSIIGLTPFMRNVLEFARNRFRALNIVRVIYLVIIFVMSLPLIPRYNNYLYQDNATYGINSIMDDFVNDNILFNNILSVDYTVFGVRKIGNVFAGAGNYLMEEFVAKDNDNVRRNVDAINNFDTNHKSIKQYMAITPGKQAILKDILPGNIYGSDEYEFINETYNSLNQGVRKIHTVKALNDVKNQEIYYKTDSRLNALGAQVVYQAFAKKASLDTSNDKFESIEILDDFNGNLSRRSSLNSEVRESLNIMLDTHDEFKASVYYVKDKEKTTSLFSSDGIDETDKTNIYLRDNQPIIKINTTSINDTNLLIFSEDSNNAVIPFITTKYQKVVVVNPKLYKGTIEDLIESEEINEILYLLTSNDLQDNNSIERVLTNNNG